MLDRMRSIRDDQKNNVPVLIPVKSLAIEEERRGQNSHEPTD
jgi:hypothetical protein